MIIQESKSRSYRLLAFLVGILNPFPRRLKMVRGGVYILDIRGRRKSRKIEQQELARRRKQKEEKEQCFTISAKGSVEMFGRSE
jgi:hypothetical protein